MHGFNEKILQFFKCPPQKIFSQILGTILLFVGIYLCLFSFDPKSSLPGNCTKTISFTNNSTKTNITNNSTNTGSLECDGGNYIGLYVLYVTATIGGILIGFMKLPPLLGMLLMGFLLRNVPYINMAIYINKLSSGYLRNLSLTIILIRAGLGLDPNVLKRLSCAVLRLAFIPCLVEATVEAVLAHYLLNISWGFSFTLGFVLAAVSPAVVVPSMLELERKGLGVDEGINTLVIAASSVDDVLAISGFGISMGLAFSSSENIALQVFRGPLEALAGIAYGVIIGLFLWYLPSLDNKKLCFYRSITLYTMAVVVMFGSSLLNIPGAGALGVLVLSFVAGLGWRKRDNQWNGVKNPITDYTDTLWWLAKPFLFGLIGAGLDISVINWSTVGLGVVTLLVGLVFRLVASFIAVFGTDLRLKERLFIPIAWLPKATVQAAIGPQVLDYAIKNGLGSDMVATGELILAIAAISILLTAPVGAVLISITSRFLLRKSRRIDPDIEVASEDMENGGVVSNNNKEMVKLNLEVKLENDEQ